uniref:Aldedh domain-containing protein n=1 Tax=Elaeophora elaphi TaxID=1147741 RepID=A0A0R3RZ58_9BILA
LFSGVNGKTAHLFYRFVTHSFHGLRYYQTSLLPADAKAFISDSQGTCRPDDVFNVISADLKDTMRTSKFLCESIDIDAISFAGSIEVKKLLLVQSANTVKQVCFELGGNVPLMVSHRLISEQQFRFIFVYSKLTESFRTKGYYWKPVSHSTYFNPTLLTNVTSVTSDIASTEMFAPAIVIKRFEMEKEVLAHKRLQNWLSRLAYLTTLL